MLALTERVMRLVGRRHHYAGRVPDIMVQLALACSRRSSACHLRCDSGAVTRMPETSLLIAP
jgi:hypothetical protein